MYAQMFHDDDLAAFRELITTADDVRAGRDIQNIPWDRLNVTRSKYRVCSELPLD